MNNTFDLRRFGRLLQKTLLERPVQIFGLIFLIMIIIFVLYALLRSVIGWNAAQNLTFIWGFIFGGCYLSSTVFNYFNTNANGSSYLTLPASHFEKWLSAVLITWVLYVVLFILFYKTMDQIFVSVYHSHLNPRDANFKRLSEAVQPFNLQSHVATQTYVMFANFSAAMFLGALYFNKISFIKTALIICIVLVGVYGLNLLLANLLFKNVSDAFPYSYVAISLAQTQPAEVAEMIRPKIEEGSIELPSVYADVFQAFFKYLLPIVLCVSAYIRLREKEF